MNNFIIHFLKEKPKTPWRDILTSKPVWALLITHLGQNWGFWTLAAQVPSYISSVLKVDIKQVRTNEFWKYYLIYLTFLTKPISLNHRNFLYCQSRCDLTLRRGSNSTQKFLYWYNIVETLNFPLLPFLFWFISNSNYCSNNFLF